jgi:hypothetical protein
VNADFAAMHFTHPAGESRDEFMQTPLGASIDCMKNQGFAAAKEHFVGQNR